MGLKSQPAYIRIIIYISLYYVRHGVLGLVWRSQPLAKNVGSGTDSVVHLECGCYDMTKELVQ